MNAAEPDDVTGPWWDATRQRRLVLQRCEGCRHVQHPPRALCTGCGSADRLGWMPAQGVGVVDACTVVMRAAAPGHQPPYVVARVRLPEGVVLLSNIAAADPFAVEVDDPVRLDWRPLADGRALPIFVAEEPE